MASSDPLQSYLQECFEEIHHRPDGELIPWRRLTIYRHLAASDVSISRSRPCQYLSMVSAEHAADAWYRDYPHDEFLGLILADTRIAWNSRRALPGLLKNREDYRAYLMELASTAAGDLPGYPAGLAALVALSHVLGFTVLDRCTWNEATSEDELDFWSSDASLYAAASKSRLINEPLFDPDSRRAFWKWWLTEAASAEHHRRKRPLSMKRLQ